MPLKTLSIILLILCLACKDDRADFSSGMEDKPSSEMAFNKLKWGIKEGSTYPFRHKMLNAVLYNDSIRTLNSTQIHDVLGQPDKSTEGFSYYLISQKKLGSWPLHTKTLVVKFKEDETVEWVKLHD